MMLAHNLRLPVRLVQFITAGIVLFGCAPSIPTASEEELKPIDRSSLRPLTGCYAYKGPRVNWNCSNCGPEPFFPFPAGVDGSPGTPSYLENGSGDRPEPNTVCLRDGKEEGIYAIAFHHGEPIAEKRYEGKVREDGYFILESYTEVNFSPLIVIWGPTHGRAALAVDSTGALRTIEERKSGAFLAFMPLDGGSVETIRRFEKATDPRAPSD